MGSVCSKSQAVRNQRTNCRFVFFCFLTECGSPCMGPFEGVRHYLLYLPHSLASDQTTGGFPCGSAGKESPCNAGDLGLNPGLGRSPEEGKGYPLQYSGLENSMDCIVRGVAKRLSYLSLIFYLLFVYLKSNLKTKSY